MCCCPAAGTESDYVNTLTNLFKDIAVAIDENEGFVGDAFGPGGSAHARQRPPTGVLCMRWTALASASESTVHMQLFNLVRQALRSYWVSGSLRHPVRHFVGHPEQG